MEVGERGARYGQELGMVMVRWTRVLWGVLPLVVVAGCAHRVAGDGAQPAGSSNRASPPVGREVVPSSGVVPSRREFEDPDRLTSRDALGDLALLNPCSLVDPDALPDTWTAVIDVPVAFNFCEITVTTKDGAVIEARVGKPQPAWNAPEDHPSGAREAGISIVPGRPGIRDGCGRNIVFADRVALEVNSYMDTTMGTTDPCTVSDTIAEHVVTAVLDGRAESLDLPESSLGALDACELVGPDLLAAVPGLGADAERYEWITGHSCWWEKPDTPAILDLEFGIGHLPTGRSGTTLHGRYTATTQYADSAKYSTCEVSGEHVPFDYKDEMALLERVTIIVRLPAGQGEAACAAATAIANGLWPALPPL